MRDRLIRIATAIPAIDSLAYFLIGIYSKQNHNSKYILESNKNGESFSPKAKWNIRIAAPRNVSLANWGDYYFGQDLIDALKKKNIEGKLLLRNDKANVSAGDVYLVIRGLLPFKPVKGAINILWVISHPEQISVREICKFDHVFAASESWAAEMTKKSGKKVNVLQQATNFGIIKPSNYLEQRNKRDIVFVGNAIERDRKLVLDAISLGYHVDIYGAGWTGKVPSQMIHETTLSRPQVEDVYSNARVVLSDHWPDMAKEGFYSNRIFDALAVGAIVISDFVCGEFSGDTTKLFMVRNKNELKSLLDQCLNSRSSKLSDNLESFRFKNSFDFRVNELIKLIK